MSSRRYLVIPDRRMENAVQVDVGTTVTEQAGLTVKQPVLVEGSEPAGDIRLTVSGMPEVPVAAEIAITHSGPVDIGRYNWVRDGDDPDDDLQFRQSPMVFGRRTDVIKSSTTLWFNKPKMLVLRSGKVLLFWLEQSNAPARASINIELLGYVVMAILDPETNRWSEPAVLGLADSPAEFAGVDACQYPDTGEIVLVVAQQDTFAVTAPDRRIYIYHSVDNGLNWYERNLLWFQGEQPDMVLTNSSDVEDESSLCSMAVELLPSGRMIMAFHTFNNLFLCYSDNRGHSWSTPVDIGTGTVPDLTVPIEARPRNSSVDIALMRNGAAMILYASGGVGPGVVITFDGVTTASPSMDPYSQVLNCNDVAMVMRPDGWPQPYVTVGKWKTGDDGDDWRDWICSRTLGTRDPDLNSTSETLVPEDGSTETYGRWLGMHAVENPARVNYPNAGVYGGFCGLAAVNHRGQILVAAQVVREEGIVDSGSDPPNLQRNSIMVYRTAYWQPLQEQLAATKNIPEEPFWGRAYNRTWDCYDVPSSWGFALTTAGAGGSSAAIVTADSTGDGNDSGGYLDLLSLAQQRSYSDTSLPAPGGPIEGVVRFLVRVRSGGSRTTDEISLGLFLGTSAFTSVGAAIRLEDTGTQTGLYVIDAGTGNELSDTYFDQDVWIEVVFAIYTSGSNTNFRGYARQYNQDADPDWEGPYQSLGDFTLSVTGGLIERLSFGHFVTTGAQRSWWKSVHLHRSDVAFDPTNTGLPLIQRGTNWVDSARNTVRAGEGSPFDQNDSGVDNIMRGSQYTAVPPQWLSRGVYVAARGEALTQGLMEFSPGYEHAAENVLSLPVGQEWRSTSSEFRDTMIGQYLSFDLGVGNEIRPDALAIFGRNAPIISVDLGDWDGTTFTSQVLYTIGIPGSGMGEDRYGHLWAWDSGSGWSYYILGRRLTVFPDAPYTGLGPWIPHQFRSLTTGPKFYIAFRSVSGNGHYVHRIEDNSEDTLVLANDVDLTVRVDLGLYNETAEDTAFTAQFSIYSDRLAVRIDQAQPSTYGVEPIVKTNTHMRGYRMVRIYSGFGANGGAFQDLDEAFMRMGWICLGRMAEISIPDFQWGWSWSTESGNQVSESSNGTSRVNRMRSPRRVLSISHGALLPPNEADDTLGVPENARVELRNSWRHWVEVARRLEVDDVPVALIWEGDRAYGEAGEDLVQVASDPNDLMPARLVEAGNQEHVFYKPANLNLANGTECVPRPGMVISGIRFREQF